MSALIKVEVAKVPPSPLSGLEPLPLHELHEPAHYDFVLPPGEARAVGAVACWQCDVVLAMLSATRAIVMRHARAQGWAYDHQGYGWLCPEHAVLARRAL